MLHKTDEVKREAKFIKHTRMHSFDHAILKENPATENGMEVMKSINHISRKAIWEPTYEISSINKQTGEGPGDQEYLNFTCSIYRPFERMEQIVKEVENEVQLMEPTRGLIDTD